MSTQLWDFVLVWISEVYSQTATENGHTVVEVMTGGDTPDISKPTDFTFMTECGIGIHRT